MNPEIHRQNGVPSVTMETHHTPVNQWETLPFRETKTKQVTNGPRHMSPRCRSDMIVRTISTQAGKRQTEHGVTQKTHPSSHPLPLLPTGLATNAYSLILHHDCLLQIILKYPGQNETYIIQGCQRNWVKCMEMMKLLYNTKQKKNFNSSNFLRNTLKKIHFNRI